MAKISIGLTILVAASFACGGSNTGSTDDTCASGLVWDNGDSESPLMHPGMDCISCHSQGEGPSLIAAGTIFPAEHEADDCFGVSGVTVQITGADQKVTTMVSNASGNFYLNGRSGSIAMPFTAKVIGANGAERAMITPQTSANCASCHTAAGANAAPGRILAP